jgi:hypothetical protein
VKVPVEIVIVRTVRIEDAGGIALACFVYRTSPYFPSNQTIIEPIITTIRNVRQHLLSETESCPSRSKTSEIRVKNMLYDDLKDLLNSSSFRVNRVALIFTTSYMVTYSLIKH